MIPTISRNELQAIADDATDHYAQRYEAYHWPNPPIFTAEEVKYVLEAYWLRLSDQVIAAATRRNPATRPGWRPTVQERSE